jgi:hypothetical protein
MAWFGEQDLGGRVMSLHALPMFHLMGSYFVAIYVSFSPLLTTVLRFDFVPLRSR